MLRKSTADHLGMLRRLTADHLGLAASVVAVAISLWSTRIAQEAQDQQAAAQRLSQANQVLLFVDAPFGSGPFFEEAEDSDTWQNAYVRNYSRLPAHWISLSVQVGEGDEELTAVEVFTSDLGSLGPCRQLHVGPLIADAIERWPDITGRSARNLRAETSLIIIDIYGEAWSRGYGERVKSYNDWAADINENPNRGGLHEGATIDIVAEPVPDCTPS
jgi:hypothetical protein